MVSIRIYCSHVPIRMRSSRSRADGSPGLGQKTSYSPLVGPRQVSHCPRRPREGASPCPRLGGGPLLRSFLVLSRAFLREIMMGGLTSWVGYLFSRLTRTGSIAGSMNVDMGDLLTTVGNSGPLPDSCF